MRFAPLLNHHEGPMPYLDLEDYRIFYNDTGDGPPLILLHNGFYSTETWDGVRAALAERFRVIDYDRRGYGRSTHLESLPDGDVVDISATELGQVMDGLSIERAHLIGHCLGGAAALVFAAAHPRRVTQLVAASVGYFGSLKSMVAADMTFVPFAQIPATLRETMRRMHGAEYIETLWELLRKDKRSYIMNERFDIRKAVKSVKQPLLMANGDRDFYFEPAHPLSMFKKMRKTAELWIVPGVGHDIHMEQPELFASEVLRFFDRNAGKASARK